MVRRVGQWIKGRRQLDRLKRIEGLEEWHVRVKKGVWGTRKALVEMPALPLPAV